MVFTYTTSLNHISVYKYLPIYKYKRNCPFLYPTIPVISLFVSNLHDLNFISIHNNWFCLWFLRFSSLCTTTSKSKCNMQPMRVRLAFVVGDGGGLVSTELRVTADILRWLGSIPLETCKTPRVPHNSYMYVKTVIYSDPILTLQFFAAESWTHICGLCG